MGNDEKTLFELVDESWGLVNNLVGEALIMDHQVPILEDVEDKLKHACRMIRNARQHVSSSADDVRVARDMLHGKPI